MKINKGAVKSQRRNIAIFLALFLFSIYLLIYRGGFHSIDEVSMYAVTESLVKFGQFNTNQIAWTQWTTSQAEAQGFFGQDGNVYSKKGLALSLAQAPFYWLGLMLPGLGMLQTVSLLNAAITAATGLIIFMMAHRIGYSLITAIATSLVFGLATIATVYAKYLFSEPLAGLLLLVAAYMLVAYRQEGGLRHIAIAGLAAGFAVLTRANNLFLLPVFGLYLLRVDYQRSNAPFALRPFAYSIGALIFSLAIPGLILLTYNTLRSGNPLQTGYDLTLFSPNVLAGFYKLLFSPLRGLFIYSPVLLLSLPGWWQLRQKHPAEAWLFLGLVGITVGLFSAWSSGEGLSWGSRFLVPVVPFFAISLAPVVEQVAGSAMTKPETQNLKPETRNPKPKTLRATFYALLPLSFAIQLLGVTINPWVFLAQMQRDFGGEFFLERTAAFYDFRYSQIVGQLQAWSVQNSDLAWWQPWGFDGLALVLSLALVAVTGWLLFRQIRNTHHAYPKGTSSRTMHTQRAFRHAPLIIPILITLAITYFLLARYNQTDLQFGPPDDAYTQALRSIQPAPNEPIITVAQHHYHVPMNRFKRRVPLIGFAQQVNPLPDTSLPLLSQTLEHQNIWLVTIGFLPAAQDNAVEEWLARNSFKVSDTWLPNEVRLVRFASVQPDDLRAVNVTMGNEIELIEARLKDVQRSGQILPVELTWQSLAHPQADYNTFVQLLDINGQLVAQHDSPPGGGYSPTANWQPGDIVKSRYALALPVDLSPGDYQLIAGLYDPATGQRLRNQNDADFISLGNVTVVDTVAEQP